MKSRIKLRVIKRGLSSLCLIGLLLASLLSGPVLAAQATGKIALVMKDLNNPFFSKMEQGAKAYASNNSVQLDIFGVERETDVEQQIAIIESLIARNYQAIVLAPIDSKRLIPVCKKALDNNIVVINIDNPLHQATLKKKNISIPFVGSNNFAGAEMVGHYIRNKLQRKGQIIIIEGIRGVENADLRRQGFIKQLTQDSSIEIVASESANWHTEDAFSLTNRLLDVHGQVDAILCANDKMALGALQALELHGLAQKVLIGSYDNIEAVRAEMRNQRIHATIEQHPELMGEYGVDLALRALDGQQIPTILPVPLDLVTYEAFQQTLGLSLSTRENPFFEVLMQGAQASAKIMGARLLVADAENHDDKQLSDILTFIEQKVSAIIINPTNADTIIPGIELANSRNIPVFTVDRKVSSGKIVSLVASDNLHGGQLAARVLARRLKGKGRVIELEGIPGASATIDRGAGFNRELKKYPNIQIVARESARFDRQQAKRIIARMIDKRLVFDAVFAHNDNMILGAWNALTIAGAKKKVLVGFDGTPEVVEKINNRQITASIAQTPREMGRRVVSTAISFLRGDRVPAMVAVDLEVIEQKD